MGKVEPEKTMEFLEGILNVLHGHIQADCFFSPDRDEKCRNMIIKLISNCKTSLDICVFNITDNFIREPVLQAHMRGVKVRIITDDEQIKNRGSDIRMFHHNRIPVRIDELENQMHHKFALLDNSELLTGSFNWTRKATERNYENIIVTNHGKLIRKFAITFEKLWEELREFKF